MARAMGDTAYKKSEIIEFDGSSYIALLDHQSDFSNFPPEAGFWDLVSASGANGLPGDQGETGTKGDPGAQGDQGIQGDQGETGPQGTAANAVDAICVALGSTAGCDLEAALAPAFPKLVFVTSTLQNGNLGGLEGADDICQGLAADQNIPGVFKAWLSDSTGSPDTRFNHASTPYALVDGTVIADSYTDLVDGSLHHKINMYETGGEMVGGAYVFTNTGHDGTPHSTTGSCQNWSSSARSEPTTYSGVTSFSSGAWTLGGGDYCDSLRHLYCFGQ
jgi:hypothetical protein